MKITPQVIIDKEFRVKFRGFDMAEVDTFLEEVAESFFKLIEENTRLNEEIDALQEKIKSGTGPAVPGQIELSPELENFLEELKQDTAAINAELVSLKQDRSSITSLEKGLQDAVAALKDAKTSAADQTPSELSDGLETALQKFTETTGAINAELAGIKEERQSFALLKKDLEEALAMVREAGPPAVPQDQAEKAHLTKALDDFRQVSKTMGDELAGIKEASQSFALLKKGLEEALAMVREARPPAVPQDQAENVHLTKALDDFRQVSKTMGDELAGIKGEVAAIQKLQAENSKDLQSMLTSRLDGLAAELAQSTAGPAAMGQAKGAVKVEPLKAAIIEEEPEDSRLADDEEVEDDSVAEDALEFLSEDDILDVDKLRGIFQSVLDDSVGDAPSSRGDDETTADLLFFDDDLMEIEHEPAVTFSIEEKPATGKKVEKMKKP